MTEPSPQLSLFDAGRRQPAAVARVLSQGAALAGVDYEPARDRARLTGQLLAIYAFMRAGRWRTLQEIADATGAPHASVSAQLRNLRKPAAGSFVVERRHREGASAGLYEYRVADGAP